MNLIRSMALAATLFVAGCGFTSEGDAARAFVKQYGEQAFDEGLINSEWFICRAASIGSILRRYGKSADLAAAWRKLCLGDPEVTGLIAPVEGDSPDRGAPLALLPSAEP